MDTQQVTAILGSDFGLRPRKVAAPPPAPEAAIPHPPRPKTQAKTKANPKPKTEPKGRRAPTTKARDDLKLGPLRPLAPKLPLAVEEPSPESNSRRLTADMRRALLPVSSSRNKIASHDSNVGDSDETDTDTEILVQKKAPKSYQPLTDAELEALSAKLPNPPFWNPAPLTPYVKTSRDHRSKDEPEVVPGRDTPYDRDATESPSPTDIAARELRDHFKEGQDDLQAATTLVNMSQDTSSFDSRGYQAAEALLLLKDSSPPVPATSREDVDTQAHLGTRLPTPIMFLHALREARCGMTAYACKSWSKLDHLIGVNTKHSVPGALDVIYTIESIREEIDMYLQTFKRLHVAATQGTMTAQLRQNALKALTALLGVDPIPENVISAAQIALWMQTRLNPVPPNMPSIMYSFAYGNGEHTSCVLWAAENLVSGPWGMGQYAEINEIGAALRNEVEKFYAAHSAAGARQE
ncbi:hypothetical protein S40288_11009 [Stachybotrys chartarum IBT 40288]|nr:hypothetical protein S40288_11009 [Stachybotrys chartarum IBT 40288]